MKKIIFIAQKNWPIINPEIKETQRNAKMCGVKEWLSRKNIYSGQKK
ncbi:hypothetical protein [Blautia sp. Marseille-P3087]|nr:hypothetical protein [Blautia sp. Marseille-P3087]